MISKFVSEQDFSKIRPPSTAKVRIDLIQHSRGELERGCVVKDSRGFILPPQLEHYSFLSSQGLPTKYLKINWQQR